MQSFPARQVAVLALPRLLLVEAVVAVPLRITARTKDRVVDDVAVISLLV